MLQLRLIALHDYVCQHYATHPALHFQPGSNNHNPDFTDQKLTAIYLFVLFQN